ncbi:hypothetical protein Tco_0482355 [Tanacetum coccineum]
MLLESEARHAKQAWSQAMDCNRVVHAELLVYRAEVRALHEQISMLQRQRNENQRARESQFGYISRYKMPSKRTTTTTTTPMTDVVIKALIAQGVVDALAEYEAHISSGNGDDSHESGSGRRTEHVKPRI